MIRWLIGILMTLAGLFALLYFLVYSNTGIKMSLYLISHSIPGSLTYEKAHLNQDHTLSIADLQYKNRSMTLHAQQLQLKWQPLSLITGHLYITTLRSQTLSVKYFKHRSSSMSIFSRNILPLNLSIKQAHIDNLALQYANYKPWLIKNMQIHHLNIGTYLSAKITLSIKTPHIQQITLILGGTRTQYRFKIHIAEPPMQWTLSGHGDPYTIQAYIREPHTLHGHLMAKARLSLKAQHAWRLHIDARHLNLQAVHPKWPSEFNMQMNSSGYDIFKNFPYFKVRALIETHASYVHIEGQHHQQWKLSWAFHLDDLSDLLSDCAGRLTGSGQLSGFLSQPYTRGSLSVAGLKLPHYQIKQLSTHWNIQGLDKTSSLILQSQQVKIAHISLSKLAIRVSGPMQAHHAYMQITLSPGDTRSMQTLSTQVTGHWNGHSWHGQLMQFNIGHWTLDRSTSMTVASTHIGLNAPLCLSASQEKCCFTGMWYAEHPWKFTVQSQGYFPEDLLFAGYPSLAIHSMNHLQGFIKGQGKTMTAGQFSGQFQAGKVTLHEPWMSQPIHFKYAAITGHIDEQQLQAKLQVNLSSHSNLTAQLHLSHLPWLEHSNLDPELVGRMSLYRINIAPWVAPFIHSPARLTAHITFKRSAHHINMRGHFRLHPGSIQLPQLQTLLKDIEGQLTYRQPGVHYTIHATSEQKPILITGSTQYIDAHYVSTLYLNGHQIPIMKTDEYSIYGSPHLKCTMVNKNIDLSGTMTINQARLHPVNFNTITTLPSDVIFMHPTKKQSTWKISMNMMLKLGQQVSFSALGATGKLSGQLMLDKKYHQPIIANGTVHIQDATYNIKENTLNISKDSSFYYHHDALNNPKLNLKVTRHIHVSAEEPVKNSRKNTVGLVIEGSFARPTLNLFASSTNMTSADILSYLLFGHPANNNTASNLILLAEILEDLKLKNTGKFSYLREQIIQGLGLSDVSLAAEDTATMKESVLGEGYHTSLVGRYLTPHIYVQYNRGIITPLDIIQVRYLISKNWAIQTETSSVGSGGDILYTIKRN